MPFSCNYSGNCESDPYGPYPTEAECLANCLGRENKDLMYLIHQYDPASALTLAPSDQVVIVQRLTGVPIDTRDIRQVLQAIVANDYEFLTRVDDLLPWIRARYPFSLAFELPVGYLLPGEIAAFDTYTDEQITQLIVRHGANLDLYRRGDIVRIMDIPLSRGRLVGYNNGTRLLERFPYPGYNGGTHFAINSFSRVDHFRYTVPGNIVRLLTNRLPPLDSAVISQISTRIWQVEIGKYHIYTRDLTKLRRDWSIPPALKLYYLSPWGEVEGRANELYTEPY